jgi:oxygen-independent coproporphyrinogen III oxidase
MQNDQAGLYIHIPFCLSKCEYCSFYSIQSINLVPEFIKAVVREMKLYKDMFKSFDTIYLGGGTPSLLSFLQIDEILKAVSKIYNINRQAEITMEVNPGDVSIKYFRSLLSLGVNRLNIGIQSFDDQLLKYLGRRHSAIDAVNTINYAKIAGFTNIGFDLIYGIHHQNFDLWKNTIQKAISFTPEHISCYQLSLEAKTPLYKKYSQQGLKLPSEDAQLRYFLITHEILENAGYLHYEISNFARTQNLRSRHNMKYWQHIPYLGIGPGAHSFIDTKRWWNKSTMKTYLKEIAAGRMPLENMEELTIEQLQLEALFLGLRMKRGIDLERYKTKYGNDLLANRKTIVDELIKNNLLEFKDAFLCPTLNGMAVADSLALI